MTWSKKDKVDAHANAACEPRDRSISFLDVHTPQQRQGPWSAGSGEAMVLEQSLAAAVMVPMAGGGVERALACHAKPEQALAWQRHARWPAGRARPAAVHACMHAISAPAAYALLRGLHDPMHACSCFDIAAQPCRGGYVPLRTTQQQQEMAATARGRTSRGLGGDIPLAGY